MRRPIAIALAFGLVFGAWARAADEGPARPDPTKGPPRPTYGTPAKVKSVDEDKGVLVVMVKKPKSDKEQEMSIKVTKDVRFIIFSVKNRKGKTITGTEGLKAAELKAGANVHLMQGPENKVFAVMVGEFPKMPDRPDISTFMTRGKIKKFDPDKGVLVVQVKDKDKAKVLELTITKETRFTIFDKEARRPKQFAAAEAAKNKAFKAGAEVMVIKSPDGTVREVNGGLPKGLVPVKPENPTTDRPPFLNGKVKKIDADKGLLTLTVAEGDEEKDVEIKVTEETRFMAMSATGGKKEFTGKDGLKADQFKKGTKVRVVKDKDGSARMIMAGKFGSFPPRKPKED